MPDYRGSRGLEKSVIRALVQESAWVGTHENVFALGPTGVGKSFVACALAQKACRDGYRAPRLLGDLRGPLPGVLDDPNLAAAGIAVARADRPSYAG